MALVCPMHGPVIPICVECGKVDGRTKHGSLFCHDCKEGEQ